MPDQSAKNKSLNALLASLRAINKPEAIEEWLLSDLEPQPSIAVPEDYRRGVYDVLRALGVLEGENPVSPMAYYLIQSLIASLRDGAFTPAMWQGLVSQECEGTGARLTHLLETHRMECVEDPTPLRAIRAVVAVIKARRGNESVYLMQWDDKAEQFQPIGGKREAFDKDNEDTLVRELHEELLLTGLKNGVDFTIKPIREGVKLHTVSATVHLMTQYEHNFYQLTNIRFPFTTDHNTRWLTSDELANGKTHDGKKVSSLLNTYLPGMLDSLDDSMADTVS